ncbi:uncharacterized protein LOC101856080 [Aplysia californica]|uniref:Uncharacterized protein LOC101856080 n=1 Tax=Aplysia californica TaxID=6500 RepID=A0ABM0ZUF5_APLCA|nr:uncharacterized protein LOC101856080 [Aplysia californica]
MVYSEVQSVLEPYEASLLLLLGFGGLSVCLALLYNFIRRRVFADANNLDRTFDAGGNVSMSLTAVTVAVQLLWPADLLQSSSVAAKYGIAGGFWYSTSVVVNIILFPLLSITFKTRAPGAKTYLQVFQARFGKAAHLVYCVFALLTNLVIISVLLIAGHALFKSLVADISDELILLIFATLFGSYSFVGGLGSTFYVSYANAVVTFIVLCIYVIKFFYQADEADLPFGTIEDVYNKVIVLEGPADNEENNFLTFWSADSMVWAVQGVFVAASVTFCDQASWQSRIAAKPMQGVLGFFFATFIWFAIPATLGTTSGIVYLAYSSGGNNTLALSDDDINAGLVTPYIAQAALGRGGGIMILIMFTMLMMATGSGEVMGVSSIIVYDICRIYIYPFKKNLKDGHCILCDQTKKGENHNTEEGKPYIVNDHQHNVGHQEHEQYCTCPSVVDCADCQADNDRAQQASHSSTLTPQVHRCPVHGQYRMYQDMLVRLKSWVMLWVTILVVPWGLVVVRSGIDLNWIFMTGCIITIQAFPGVVLAIVWVKTTGVALVIGGLVGLVSGVITCLARASTLEGGLSDFLLNTSEGYSVMAGSCVTFFVSLVLDVVISFCTHRIKSETDADQEWQKLRDIDNPLSPWREIYKEEFPHLNSQQRPSFKQLDSCFRKAKLTAIIGTVGCLLLFVIIIPGAMASLHVLTSSEFKAFLMILQIWTFVMACIVIVLVPVEEIWTIVKQMRKRTLF